MLVGSLAKVTRVEATYSAISCVAMGALILRARRSALCRRDLSRSTTAPAEAAASKVSSPIAFPAVEVPSVAVPPATERVAAEAPAAADSAATADAADAAAAEALASLVIPDEERHCQGCGTLGKLLRCGGCQRVFFCSRTCQGLAWPRHKDLCAEIKAAKTASASDTRAPSPQHAWLCALLVQNAKARAAEAAFRMGSASSYQRSAELAREAARVASLRAALAAHEPARRVCCMHEAQMHGMSANAWLRYGDVPAALRAARLASTCAEASGDVAQCVEAKIVLGTAFMKLPDDAESHRDVDGLATEPVAEAIAIFREAVALCEREWAISSAGTPLAAPAPTCTPGPPSETPAGRLRAAEASARSNLARALHGSDPARALVELERAVALRRRVLADSGAEANTEADAVPEKRRRSAGSSRARCATTRPSSRRPTSSARRDRLSRRRCRTLDPGVTQVWRGRSYPISSVWRPPMERQCSDPRRGGSRLPPTHARRPMRRCLRLLRRTRVLLTSSRAASSRDRGWS